MQHRSASVVAIKITSDLRFNAHHLARTNARSAMQHIFCRMRLPHPRVSLRLTPYEAQRRSRHVPIQDKTMRTLQFFVLPLLAFLTLPSTTQPTASHSYQSSGPLVLTGACGSGIAYGTSLSQQATEGRFFSVMNVDTVPAQLYIPANSGYFDGYANNSAGIRYGPCLQPGEWAAFAYAGGRFYHLTWIAAR